MPTWTLLRHNWRRLGISAEEVREFCVAQRANARAELAGRPVDSYDPALKEHRTVCFLAGAAKAAQTLQALCGDCHSEKTLRESAQPQPGELLAPASWSTPGAHPVPGGRR